jgi:hypothetical protein
MPTCSPETVHGVSAAECLDGRPQPRNGALRAPAGTVGAEPVPAALGGDGPVDMAISACEDAERGAAAGESVGEGGEPACVQTLSQVG